MIAIWLVLCAMYGTLILVLLFGFNNLVSYKAPKTIGKVSFSIVVPFKDEEQHLLALLNSIKDIDYPKTLFQVILVNDESTDASVAIVEQFIAANTDFDIQLLTNVRTSGSPKKDAITLAVSAAKHEWIVATDADCVVPEKWLHTLAGSITRRNPKMVVMPVTYEVVGHSFLAKFQLLDFLSLMGSTMGGFGIGRPFMCNGANLAYEKEVFLEVDGFKGNNHIGSGDDVFLMEKILEHYPGRVSFLKSVKVLVKTFPQPTFKALMQQRKRWAAKASAYNNPFAKLVAIVVFLMNMSLPLFTLFWLLYGFPFKLLILGFTLKVNLDFFLIYKVANYFKQQYALKIYYQSAFLYPAFCTYVAVYSFFGTYSWKGNTFKK